ncbi:uncharacterized protein LOC143616437 [Bidens hawaiensis]|uniref:uncharacterized protein LOC143616437 n=1 Tax=Bidens hawaiensis TaxID=980011 RepID=UPI00404A3695
MNFTDPAIQASWLKQHSAPTAGISFSPSNNKKIASVGLDKKLYTFDLGSRRHSFRVPYESPFSSVAFHDDGNTLAAGTTGKLLLFYSHGWYSGRFSTRFLHLQLQVMGPETLPRRQLQVVMIHLQQPALLFPPSFAADAGDSHSIFYWKPSSTSLSLKPDEPSSITPPEAWGGGVIGVYRSRQQGTVASRFAMLASSSGLSSGSMMNGLQDLSFPSSQMGLNFSGQRYVFESRESVSLS